MVQASAKESGALVGRRDRLSGRLLGGRFRVGELLAKGGMGRVYRALQLPLGREVALKVLSPQAPPGQLASFHRRFALEASLGARLRHPHNTTIYDFGRHPPNIFFLAMELLTGVSLRLALLRERFFPPPRAVHVAIGIARALQEAHDLGAVHRDLKPANITLERRGHDAYFVKVLDFGLVKHLACDDEVTQPGRFLGSPGYMAPEQIRGDQACARVDIYALGVLLYEMLAGRPPFVATGSAEVLMAHVHDPLPLLGEVAAARAIAPGLARVVHRCLAKAPAHRYGSMRELLDALAPYSSWDETIAEVAHPACVQRHPEAWSVVGARGVLARSPPLPATARDVVAAPAAATAATPARRAAPARALPAAHLAPAPPRPWRLGVGAIVLAVAGAGVAAALVLAAPRQGTLTLITEPAGALAFVDGQPACASTPCTVPWRRATRAGRWLHVRLVLPGREEFVTSRRMRRRHLRLVARMAAVPAVVSEARGLSSPPPAGSG